MNGFILPFKYEVFGVQEHGGHVEVGFPEFILFVAAMWSVADDGVEDVRHVFAELMKATCLGA